MSASRRSLSESGRTRTGTSTLSSPRSEPVSSSSSSSSPPVRELGQYFSCGTLSIICYKYLAATVQKKKKRSSNVYLRAISAQKFNKVRKSLVQNNCQFRVVICDIFRKFFSFRKHPKKAFSSSTLPAASPFKIPALIIAAAPSSSGSGSFGSWTVVTAARRPPPL